MNEPSVSPVVGAAGGAVSRCAPPDFVIIGAAKAGTTSLQQSLARHPGLFLTDPKEPEYFCRSDRTRAWYDGLFAAAQPHQLRGEASTNYSCGGYDLTVPMIARRLAREAPHARLIYLIRHPVERAYSFYVEQVRTQLAFDAIGAAPSFEQWLERDPRTVAGSRYLDVIQAYLRWFPASQMLILTLEELQTQPLATLNRVLAFLGVEPATTETIPHVNDAARRGQGMLRHRLLEPLRRLPWLGSLGAKLPRPVRDLIYRAVATLPYARRERQRITCPPMRPQTRSRLLAELREPTQCLAAHLGTNLSHWLV